MKVQKLLLTAALLAASSAFATVHCSNADGSLVYEGYVYEGGIPPRPGMVNSSQTWTYKGQVLAKAVHYVEGPMTQLPIVEKAESVKEILRQDGGSGTNHIWAEIKTLSREDGGALLPDRADKSLSDWFLCHEVVRFLP